jgi:hypothetical protein
VRKFAYILLFLGLLFLPSCSKFNQPEENINPAAKSDYSKATVMADAENWRKIDPIKRHVAVIADTGSMLRVFDSRSIALIETIGPNDSLNIGDIIAYSNPAVASTLISHRLIEIDGDTLVFKGDNNQFPDPLVQRSAVRSRIVGILYTDGK